MRKLNLEHVYEPQQFDSKLLNIIFNVADEVQNDLSAEQSRNSQVLKDNLNQREKVDRMKESLVGQEEQFCRPLCSSGR